MMACNYEKMWEMVEQNAELKAEMETADTLEKVHEVLVRNHVDVTLEEVQKMAQEKQGELAEGDLEEVSGGCFRRIIGYRIKWIRVPPRMIPIPVLVPIYR